jgi:hypothetical protein
MEGEQKRGHKGGIVKKRRKYRGDSCKAGVEEIYVWGRGL